MMVKENDIFTLHAQVKNILIEFQWDNDHAGRRSLLKSSKKTVTKYLKTSQALINATHSSSSHSIHLKTFLRNYIKEINQDAKTIIAFYLKYGHCCDDDQHEAFYTGLAVMQILLKKRLDIEAFYLLPEYRLVDKRKYHDITQPLFRHEDTTQPLAT